MAFYSESSASCLGQLTDQSCLNSSAHPGLLAYNTAATNQNIYLAEKMKMQTQGLMMPRLTAMSAYSHGLYPHSIATANSLNFNEHSLFPSIAMALDAGHLKSYQSNSQNVKPAIQGANLRSGYQDARNLKSLSTLAHPFYWRKRGNSVPTEGMTRTRDKYRVVYTEKQRVGLEKEFKTNKFITMQRKMELSKELDLSERQIKIWFQNRRAKERRQRRKTETMEDDILDGDMSDPVTELQQNDHSENVQPNDTLFQVDVSRHSYPSLQTLEDLSTKSQCRFQQNNSRIFETSDVRETQKYQSITRLPTSPAEWNQASAHITSCNESPSEWRQTSAHVGSCNVSPSELRQTSARMTSCNVSPVEWRHPSAQMTSCDVSPSEWQQTSAQMTSCNISPFTANPDWNLTYRT